MKYHTHTTIDAYVMVVIQQHNCILERLAVVCPWFRLTSLAACGASIQTSSFNSYTVHYESFLEMLARVHFMVSGNEDMSLSKIFCENRFLFCIFLSCPILLRVSMVIDFNFDCHYEMCQSSAPLECSTLYRQGLLLLFRIKCRPNL
jgi:hypothetical protein